MPALAHVLVRHHCPTVCVAYAYAGTGYIESLKLHCVRLPEECQSASLSFPLQSLDEQAAQQQAKSHAAAGARGKRGQGPKRVSG